MAGKTRIGFIGVGLMGHGVARNILEKGGYPLTILGNRNRQPVDDLVARGAKEAHNPAEVARASDIVFLCLPSSAEVEATVGGRNGLDGALKRGAMIVDTTTADPAVTRKIAAGFASQGVDVIDAALGRTPKEAEDGKLSTYVGGDKALLERVRPIMETYCDTIIHCGPLGAGTTCKLVNNSITIGTASLFAEGFATAAKLGVDLTALADVISAGGANGRMWQMIEPWIREGDDSKLRGPLRIAAKDIRTYGRMAEGAGVAAFIAQAVSQSLRLALNQGYENTFLPALPGVVAKLNGAKIRDFE